MAKIVILLLFCTGTALPASWSGVLVKSDCWINEEHNVNPTDTTLFVDRDRNEEIRYCRPNAKTTSFILVPPDGVGLKLDRTGNAKAAGLIHHAGKESEYRISVTGRLVKNTINVDSLAPAK